MTSLLHIFVNPFSVLQFLRHVLFLYLQVALHIPGAYNLTLHLPTIIGTVPFRRRPLNFEDSHFYRETQAHFSALNFLGVPNPPPYRETITPPPPFEGKSQVQYVYMYTQWSTVLGVHVNRKSTCLSIFFINPSPSKQMNRYWLDFTQLQFSLYTVHSEVSWIKSVLYLIIIHNTWHYSTVSVSLNPIKCSHSYMSKTHYLHCSQSRPYCRFTLSSHTN